MVVRMRLMTLRNDGSFAEIDNSADIQRVTSVKVRNMEHLCMRNLLIVRCETLSRVITSRWMYDTNECFLERKLVGGGGIKTNCYVLQFLISAVFQRKGSFRSDTSYQALLWCAFLYAWSG